MSPQKVDIEICGKFYNKAKKIALQILGLKVGQ
jgi:hypothetical protein